MVMQDLEEGRKHCLNGIEFHLGMTRAIKWTLGTLYQKRDRSPDVKAVDSAVRNRIGVALRYLSKCAHPVQRPPCFAMFGVAPTFAFTV